MYHLNFSPKCSGMVVFVLYVGVRLLAVALPLDFFLFPQPQTARLFQPLVPSVFSSALVLGPRGVLSAWLILSAKVRLEVCLNRIELKVCVVWLWG